MHDPRLDLMRDQIHDLKHYPMRASLRNRVREINAVLMF
jgi:hypothetical protein